MACNMECPLPCLLVITTFHLPVVATLDSFAAMFTGKSDKHQFCIKEIENKSIHRLKMETSYLEYSINTNKNKNVI